MVNQLETAICEGQCDESDSFHYQDVLAQIRATILILGNWKNLPAYLADVKCTYKDVTYLNSDSNN